MVTKLNRKSLRAQRARKESGSLSVCSHCPSLCCTQTPRERDREKEMLAQRPPALRRRCVLCATLQAINDVDQLGDKAAAKRGHPVCTRRLGAKEHSCSSTQAASSPTSCRRWQCNFCLVPETTSHTRVFGTKWLAVCVTLWASYGLEKQVLCRRQRHTAVSRPMTRAVTCGLSKNSSSSDCMHTRK